MMTERQKYALKLLKEIYDQDFEINGARCSPTLIGKWIGLKFLGHSSCHSSTGSPILKKLVQLDLVERNDKGWYRFKQTKNK